MTTFECFIDGQKIKTVAASEAKARTNAYYRYKKMTRYTLEEVRHIPMVVKLVENV